MSYATQRDAYGRTPQDLLILGVRECQNHYTLQQQQLLQYTQDWSNGVWVFAGGSVDEGVSTVEVAPDGTQTLEEILFLAMTEVRQVVTGEAVTSKAYTASIWIRTTVGAGARKLTIRIRDAGTTEFADKQITTTPGIWNRFFVHKLFSATPTGDLVFVIRSGATDDTGTFAVWGANVSRNPADEDKEVRWPYRKRVAEAASTISVNASRCEAADAGDASRCYYSRPTCQDPDNFNEGNSYEQTPELRGIREYKICRKDSPLAVAGGNVMPLMGRLDVASQEIRPDRGVTINERVGFVFDDDAGPGLWNPRQSFRGALVNTATGAGTFWRRWLSIYRNYTNPAGYLIHKAGFVESGGTEDDYQQRAKYLLRNVVIRGDDKMGLECTDRLKLARKDIPAKLSRTNVLFASIDSSATSIEIVDAAEISEPVPGADIFISGAYTADYQVVLEIDYDVPGSEEKVTVHARDLATNKLTVIRGRWGTSVKSHVTGAKIREVAEFGTEASFGGNPPLGKNPIDIIIELYRFAGIAMDDIDVATLEQERDIWLSSTVDSASGAESGMLLRRTIIKKKKVEDLVTEIRELLMIMVWVNEDQKVTGKVFAAPTPTIAVDTFTDANSIIDVTIDDNEESRLTRSLIAWELLPGEDGDKPEDYNLIQIHIALDEEESPYYGEQRSKVVLTEWLQPSDLENPPALAARIVSRYRRGARQYSISTEIKDDDTAVGDAVFVETDKVQGFDGSTASVMALITKKKRKDNRIVFDAVEIPFSRVLYWAPDGLPDYDSASAANKRYGYYGDSQGLVGATKEPGYTWW